MKLAMIYFRIFLFSHRLIKWKAMENGINLFKLRNKRDKHNDAENSVIREEFSLLEEST